MRSRITYDIGYDERCDTTRCTPSPPCRGLMVVSHVAKVALSIDSFAFSDGNDTVHDVVQSEIIDPDGFLKKRGGIREKCPTTRLTLIT